MKYLFSILLFAFFIISCDSTRSTGKVATGETQDKYSDTVRIANEEVEYEVIIVEPGFNKWLAMQPPMSHFEEKVLEVQNRQYVREYNARVFSENYPSSLYVHRINYDPRISYGLKVNYLLYHYFKFFETTYNQKLR